MERRSVERRAADGAAATNTARPANVSIVSGVNRRDGLALTHFWRSWNYAGPMTRAWRRSSFPRPYICRLTSLSLERRPAAITAGRRPRMAVIGAEPPANGLGPGGRMCPKLSCCLAWCRIMLRLQPTCW